MLIQNLGVFSAYAEVFPKLKKSVIMTDSFLRVRGGVSHRTRKPRRFARFSPRTRRCFYAPLFDALFVPVFSAYAEVFLS